jgi:uncharacterized protein (DUF2141 family)
MAFAMLVASVAQAGDLRIRVRGIESDAGQVRIALFTSATAFEAKTPRAGAFTQAREGGVTFVFTDLPPGRYGTSCFHDRDGDGKLGANPVGFPNEPFGFSGELGRFSPPRFEDFAFDLGPDGAEIEIRLR